MDGWMDGVWTRNTFSLYLSDIGIYFDMCKVYVHLRN